MPNLTFVLPHWLYWSGLVLFPLLAMYMVRQRAPAGTKSVTLPIAYLMWLVGGFVGMHRFYARNLWGFAYIPLFIGILYCNAQGRPAREPVSNVRNDILGVEFDIERAQAALKKGTSGAAEKIAAAQAKLAALQEQFITTTAAFDEWQLYAGLFAAAIALFLFADAFVLPRLTRRCAARETAPPAALDITEVLRRGSPPDARSNISNAFMRTVDRINGLVGEFICYWSVVAVFVYFYEVVARYVFNSPTNWAHEGMFLMFGMQYLLAGGYALREDAHVRVDVIYMRFSLRTKAMIDVFTSIFFFIFTIALLWTGVTFFNDSASVWEVSFTEWAIQFWPIKATIFIGAALIILQGLAKLIRDVTYLSRGEA